MVPILTFLNRGEVRSYIRGKNLVKRGLLSTISKVLFDYIGLSAFLLSIGERPKTRPSSMHGILVNLSWDSWEMRHTGSELLIKGNNCKNYSEKYGRGRAVFAWLQDLGGILVLAML